MARLRAPRWIVAEDGQALAESAWLLALLLVGAGALGWPFVERLVEAWDTHEASVRFVVDSPLP